MALKPQAVGALSLVTSTATSPTIDISRQERTSVEFIAASVSSGNGVFTIDGSNDKTNWVLAIAFQDAQSTASTTYATSKTLGVSSCAGAYVPPGFEFIRVKCTVTTDGSYSAIVFSI